MEIPSVIIIASRLLYYVQHSESLSEFWQMTMEWLSSNLTKNAHQTDRFEDLLSWEHRYQYHLQSN